MLIGNLNSYSETSFNRINDISYDTYEGFIQDSWKVNRRLTLELGLRITQFTPWADNLGFGFSDLRLFEVQPELHAARSTAASCGTSATRPFRWAASRPRRRSIQPRFGVAYALSDNTVLRGGWGRYYYHSGQFTTGLNVSAGMQTVTLSNNQGTGGNTPLMASELDTLNFSHRRALHRRSRPQGQQEPRNRQLQLHHLAARAVVRLWSKWPMSATRRRNILNQSGVGSDINLVPVGAMLSSKNGGVDPQRPERE